MKTYICGDVHNRVERAKAFLDRYKPERVIWLGDFFDSVGDTPEDARQTALFVKYLIDERPQDVLLQGNHDTSYRFPQEKYSAYGFSEDKMRAVNEVLPRHYWNKFQLFHVEEINGQKVVFSHAGFSHKFLCHPTSFDVEFYRRVEKMAFENGNKTDYNPFLDSMFGPQWVRWPLGVWGDICQVIGHTTATGPQVNKPIGCAEWILNMDCFPIYVAYFNEQGIFEQNLNTGLDKKLKFCLNDIREE